MADANFVGFQNFWGIPAMVTPQINAKLKVFGTLNPEGFEPSYLNSAAHYSIFGTNTSSRLATQEEYEKAFQKFKDDPSEYYKFAIKSSAGSVGHTASLYDYFGGQVDPVAYKEAPEAQYTKIVTEAVQKGYLKPDEVISISEPAYQSAYSKQSGYNNPDLRSDSGFFGKTLGAITSNPLTTLAFPVVAAAGLGAFSGAGAAGTDYLGTQALGDASTGAVGSGSTGFGINASAPSFGINAGTGSLLTAAPVESAFGINISPSITEFGTFNPSTTSGYGIDTGSLSGMEYLGGTGSLPVGTAGLTAEQLATATQLGQVGTNAASGLGYLGGAESLPAGTAGIKGVAAPMSLNLQDIQRGLRLGQALLGGQPQQQVGQPQQQRQVRPMGQVDYSPTLNLLQSPRALTPNVYSLLG